MEANHWDGLDKIHLPGRVWPSFFGDTLVKIKQSEGVPASKPIPALTALGGHKKHIVFLVSDTQHKYLEEGLMDFLQNLLVACSLSMEDIALVNFNQSMEVNSQTLKEALRPRKVVVFGMTASQLGQPREIPLFQIATLGEAEYLFCPALAEIQGNKEYKRQLWNNLQSLFQLKKSL